MKSFESGSIYERFDENGDGIVSDEELAHAREIMELELREEKAKSQRQLAIVAMASMVGFAILPILPFVPESRLSTLASLSDMLFLSQASIVGMYFGATAYMAKK